MRLRRRVRTMSSVRWRIASIRLLIHVQGRLLARRSLIGIWWLHRMGSVLTLWLLRIWLLVLPRRRAISLRRRSWPLISTFRSGMGISKKHTVTLISSPRHGAAMKTKFCFRLICSRLKLRALKARPSLQAAMMRIDDVARQGLGPV